MKNFTRVIYVLLAIAVVGGALFFVCSNYSYVFSKKISGEVVAIDRVTQPLAILGQQASPEQMYSFAVAVRTKDGHIFTASTEDRQWAVVQKGNCVEARFYPYPPWNLSKGGTYFGARLDELFNDCAALEAKNKN